MNTAKLKKEHVCPVPVKMDEPTEYTATITFRTSGGSGHGGEIEYETSPDIFELSPAQRRREIATSLVLTAFANALENLNGGKPVKGMPSTQQVREEKAKLENTLRSAQPNGSAPRNRTATGQRCNGGNGSRRAETEAAYAGN